MCAWGSGSESVLSKGRIADHVGNTLINPVVLWTVTVNRAEEVLFFEQVEHL